MMRHLPRVTRAVLVLAAVAFAACTGGGSHQTADRGIGGTGIDGGGRGIGGTGRQADVRGLGGTGIYGTVTAFGSIWVNGKEVAYGEETPVTRAGAPADPEVLAVGQVVAVLAEEAEGDWRARHIAIHPVLRGPVESVDAQAREITVLGQTVFLPEDGRGDDTVSLAALRPGETVAVHGFRQGDGLILATRLEHAAAGNDYMIGVVEARNGRDWVVSGQPVAVRSDTAAAPGATVALTGSAKNGRLTAETVEILPPLPFARQAERLIIEGLIVRSGDDRALMTAGGSLPLDREAGELETGSRVVADGRIERGRMRIRGLDVVSERPWPARYRSRLGTLVAPQRPVERPSTGAPERIKRPERREVIRPDVIERPMRPDTRRPERPAPMRPGR